MKNVKKIITIVLLIIILMSTNTYSYAKGIKSYMNKFGDTSQGVEELDLKTLTDIVCDILGWVQLASAIITIMIIAWIGFRFIVQTPDVQQELRRSMFLLVIGSLAVFGAASIAKFIIGVVEPD